MAENHPLEAAEARSPATSPARLAELMLRHAEAVLANPAFQLLLVENPHFWTTLPHPGILAGARYCPADFVQWVLAQPDAGAALLHELVLNRALPVHLRRAAFLRTHFSLRWSQERRRLAELLTPEEVALLERAGVAA